MNQRLYAQVTDGHSIVQEMRQVFMHMLKVNIVQVERLDKTCEMLGELDYMLAS